MSANAHAARFPRPWRAYLNPSELATIDALDREIGEMQAKLVLLRHKRERLRNTGTKRAAKAGAVLPEAAE